MRKLGAKKHRKNKEKKSGNRSAQRGPRYWVAMGTMGALVAYSAIGSHTIATAKGLGLRGKSDSAVSQSKATASAQRFDIKPGPLEEVLANFQSVTGVQIQVPNDAIRGLSSPGVSGIYSAEQALKQLLTGTGISYQFTSPQAVTLEVQGPAATVDISAGLPSIAASPKSCAKPRNRSLSFRVR